MELSHEDRYRVPPLAESPWLITTYVHQKRNKLGKQTFRTNTRSYVRIIPELDRNFIVGAHQGWLILRNRANCSIYYIWNPVTSQLISLPELVSPEVQENNEFILPSACVFTSSPDHVDNPYTCVLVLFFRGGLTFSCRPTNTISSNRSWRKQTLELDGIRVGIRGADVLEGVIYAEAKTLVADCKGRYYSHFVRINVAFDCPDSNHSITLHPMNIELPTSKIKFLECKQRIYVVECCGVLYYISIRSWLDGNFSFLDIINVMIWRFDLSQMEWIKIDSFRNRAFLIDSNRSCTWCWAPRPSIEENCIYLLNNSRLYSYDLQDDSYTVLSYPSFFSDPTSHAFSDVPTWFMPLNYQRLSLKLEDPSRMNEKIEYFQERVDDIHESFSGTLLPKLPTEILKLISRRLNLFDCMNLGATCKSLYEANLVAEWRANSSYPLFMVRKDNIGTYELLDPFQSTSHVVSTFDDSPTDLSTFEFCKDGWLVLRSKGDHLKFLNPFTRKKMEYFDPCLVSFAVFGFSACPTSSDFEIVGIFGEGSLYVDYFEATKGEWFHHDIEFNPKTDIHFQSNYRSSPRYHKNAFYFIGRNGCLGVLETNQGSLRWHVYQSPFIDDDDDDNELCIDSCYLVELDGELASVFIGDMGSWVQVFKFDESEKCWVKLDTLGDHVLFVSRASSFSVKAIKDDMKNRIYLPRRMGNEIVFYSLNTGKYHTSSSAKSMNNFYGMKAQSSSCWVY